LPVVLCYFEGLSLDEAARRLRCPAGTLRSRLARAREKLRHGLARRGVALPMTLLAVVLAPRAARASIPPLLCESTTRAATAFAAHHAACGAISASAAALAQEVLGTMLIQRIKGTVKATHDIKLRRGVLIRGKVTEEGTGRPLPDSSIQFNPIGGDGKIIDFSTVNDANKGIQLRKDFTVKPGETVDLGDILIEKPNAR